MQHEIEIGDYSKLGLVEARDQFVEMRVTARELFGDTPDSIW